LAFLIIYFPPVTPDITIVIGRYFGRFNDL